MPLGAGRAADGAVLLGDGAVGGDCFARRSMENFEIIWGLPLSVSWKSSMVRLSTGWPLESRTMTGTGMRVTPERKVTGDSFVVISAVWGKAEIPAMRKEISRK